MLPIGSAKITSASDVRAPLLAIGHIASGHRLRMDEGNRAGGGDQGKQENGSEKLGHSCPPLAIGRISVGGLQMDGCGNANASVTIKAVRSSRTSLEASCLTLLDQASLGLVNYITPNCNLLGMRY